MEVQDLVEAHLGVHPCLWQIKVARKVLEQDNIITVATTVSGKSLTYWIPLLFVKHGIVIVVTPLKLLGRQFAEGSVENSIRAVLMTAANTTNELFDVCAIFQCLCPFSDVNHANSILQNVTTISSWSAPSFSSMMVALTFSGE